MSWKISWVPELLQEKQLMTMSRWENWGKGNGNLSFHQSGEELFGSAYSIS